MCPASKEPFDERFPRQAEVIGDLRKDRRDRAHAKRIVSGDRDVVLALILCRETHAADRLARPRVSHIRKSASEILAREVSGNLIPRSGGPGRYGA